MGDVRLDFYDLDAEALPDVCMRCGATAVARPVKQFSWMPYWARFVPPIIGVWFVKRRRVPVPLCERHKNHWTIRYLIGIGGILLVLGLLIVGGCLFATNIDSDPDGPLTMIGGLLMGVAGVLFIAWLVALIALATTQIGAAEITDDTIVLKNVHGDFSRAYREQTRSAIAPEVDEAIRDQWGRPAAGRKPQSDYPPDDKYGRG